MENLTVINGSNCDFVFIDHESDKNGITAFFVPVDLYEDGFYEDLSLIPIIVEYVSQGADRVIGGWDSPIIQETSISGDFGDIDHPIPDQTDHRFRRKLTM